MKNLQGDIIGMVDASGNTVVEYTYDSWGKLLSITGSLKDTVGVQNPFRYRGYYYDTETGMYYLQSRYYDAGIRRFISADSQVNMSMLGTYLFCYCENNPVMLSDTCGYVAFSALAGIAVKEFLTKIAVATVSLIVGLGISNTTTVKNKRKSLGNSISQTIVRSKNISAAKDKENSKATAVSVIQEKMNARQDKTQKVKYHVHHVVAKKALAAEPAREILSKDDVKIGINDVENLVPLTTGFHQQLHTAFYYTWVNTSIEYAYSNPQIPCTPKGSVENELKEIKGILIMLNQQFPY